MKEEPSCSDSFQRWLQEHFSEDGEEAKSSLQTAVQSGAVILGDKEPTSRKEVPPGSPPGPSTQTAPENSGDAPKATMEERDDLKGLKNMRRNQSQAQKKAHRRYRERKRLSIHAMEAEVHEKARLLAMLQRENTELHNRSRVLETAIHASQETMDILNLLDSISISSKGHSNGSSSGGSTRSSTSPPPGSISSGAGRKSGSIAGSTNPLDTWGSRSQDQHRQQPLPGLGGQQSASHAPQDALKQAEKNALRAAGYISDWDSSLQAYKDFVVQVSQLLQRAEGMDGIVPEPRAYQELEQVTWTMLARMKPWMAHMGQELVYYWQNRNLETGRKEDCTVLWPRVLQKLDLDPKQELELLACYRMFGVCLERLLEERQQLTRQYALVQAALDPTSRHGSTEVLMKLHEDLDVSLQLLQGISKNLKAYGTLDKLFATSVVGLLSGVQVAKAILHSYPFLPFWHEMISHLQKLHEEAQRNPLGLLPMGRKVWVKEQVG